MFSCVSNRLLAVLLLFAVSLDLLFVALGWTWLTAVLTAVLLGLPLGFLVSLAREAMDQFGIGAWDGGPIRPPIRPTDSPSEAPRLPGPTRPAVSRHVPDIAAAANRTIALILIMASLGR
jgi:hypothetical protein